MPQQSLGPDEGDNRWVQAIGVSAVRSLDGSKGVSFHTFSLPKDHSVRLIIKNLGKQHHP
jgi:hypothetical protein